MRQLPYDVDTLDLMPMLPEPEFAPTSSGGGSESQDGVLYCTDPNHGIVMIDLETETYELTGVITPTTALGYGHDGWWYANAGPSNVEARTLVRLQTELVRNPVTQELEPVIEPIGAGARRIEDVASSPDGSTLYGVGDGYLYTIDRQTGQQTDLAPLGFPGSGIAFLLSGELVVNDGAVLYYVDPADGRLTYFQTTTNVGNDLAGMPMQTTTAGPPGQPGTGLGLPPNPFSPGSRIQFAVDLPQTVRVAVYDVAGRFVREIVDGPWEAGTHRATWDGRDATGRTVASGTYFLRLTSSTGAQQSRKVSLVR